MPSAKVIFQSGNWVNGYTHDELHNVYAEIVTYFTEEVVREVFEKYDKSVAYKNQNI
jgi:hypothetical protein